MADVLLYMAHARNETLVWLMTGKTEWLLTCLVRAMDLLRVDENQEASL